MITRKSTDEQDHEKFAVTPEMVEAGVHALIEYEPVFDMPEEGAVHVFCAMMRALKVEQTKKP